MIKTELEEEEEGRVGSGRATTAMTMATTITMASLRKKMQLKPLTVQ